MSAGNVGIRKSDGLSDISVSSANICLTSLLPDSLKRLEIQRRTRQILESGSTPSLVFVCRTRGGLLTYQSFPEKKSFILLFTTPHAARDYMRATGAMGEVAQVEMGNLPALGKECRAGTTDSFVLNKCPRCAVFYRAPVDALLEPEDFMAAWAVDSATRWVVGETLVREALDYMAESSLAKARTALEQIRDHVECGLPYLHQMIGLIADLQEDHATRLAADERLKEFAPHFDGPTDFSPEVVAIASVGLMRNFGILPHE